MALEWTVDLSVGVAEIDAQHQELIRRANDLLDAIIQGRGVEELSPMLDFLGEYARDHFAAEERLMAATAYPRSAEHKREHVEFVGLFGPFRQRVETEGATAELLVCLHKHLCGWLVDHMCRTDKALGEFVRKIPAGSWRF